MATAAEHQNLPSSLSVVSPGMLSQRASVAQGPLPDEPDDDAEAPDPQQAVDVDWSSPDQVSAHVSKTTMAGMQKLWRAHAAAMDVQGRAFAQTVFTLHSQALKEVAAMRTFEPKAITATLNNFTSQVREEVMRIFQVMRQADDSFAQGLYQTSRKNFARNLRDALEAKDAACAEKIKRLKAQHEQALAQQRQASLVALQQDAQQQRQEIARQLKEDNRKKLAEAITAITAQLNKQYASQLAAAAANGAAAGLQSSSAQQPGLPGGDAPGSAAPTRPATAAPPFPFAALASAAAGGGEGGAGDAGLSLDLLRALAQQDDDSIGSVLARKEMEAAIKSANQLAEEQRAKVEELSVLLHQERADIEAWKDKWTQESSKTDGIKRECLQVIIKCEKKVKALQEEHHAEMSKRDVVIQRCKDTILRLEARLAEVLGYASEPRLAPVPANPSAVMLPEPSFAAGPLAQRMAPPSMSGTHAGAARTIPDPAPAPAGTGVQPSLQSGAEANGSPDGFDGGDPSDGLHLEIPPAPAAPGGTASVSASPAGDYHLGQRPSTTSND